MGDFSDCVEMTAAYANYTESQLGRVVVSFDCTGNAGERIYGKDQTAVAGTAVFNLEYVQLACSSASVRLYDGSAGGFICGIVGSDASSETNLYGTWDFRNDPLKTLVTDNTQSLCISAGNGHTCGLIKGYWGPG